MMKLARSCLVLMTVFAMAALSGCVTPGPDYSNVQPAVQVGPSSDGSGYLTVGPHDRTYVVRVEDRTPYGLMNLPQSMNVLYQKGYDQVRRNREADFEINVSFVGMARDNPEQRAGNMVGGALLGAATGAIIGGALGDPGAGAAIGAGSGAALGLVAPAGAAMVRIDIRTQSFRDGTTSFQSAVVDLVHTPPHEAPYAVDMQVARMLEGLPGR